MEGGDDDSLNFSWTDEEVEVGDTPVESKLVVLYNDGGSVANFEEACSSAGPSSLLFKRFLAMGFSEELITRAIQENREGDEESILNTILTYRELQNSPDGCGVAAISFQKEKDADQCLENSPDGYGIDGFSLHKEKHADQCLEMVAYDSDFGSSDYGENIEGDSWSDFSNSDTCPGLEETSPFSSETREKLKFLEEMNFPKEEALIAIERCGPDATIDELANFLIAAQMARAEDPYYLESPTREKRSFSLLGKRKRKMADRNRERPLTEDEEMIRLPNPMVGFGVPTMPSSIVQSRKLPEEAAGHPYFFFENVALAPKGVWDTISRHLYHVEPEFIDSKYFCAAARKRGYIHNLPVSNRFTIMPPPRLTIQEALPTTRKWWPTWDPRTKLNCLQTVFGSAQLTDRIRKALKEYDGEGDPPPHVQKFVLEQCRKWNLIWVGRNRVAILEPDEVEKLLGFPMSHTRGISRTDRYKSLGNSFQVDTVAYLLSPLKEMFPTGINVLSLFSGIGGAEVALHHLGVPLKNVVSVEILEVNRNVMKSWWEQTNQRGTLRHINDVLELTFDKLMELTGLVGGFDLVIGGSPCNNLTGGNRCTRDGLEGKDSALFYEYVRIVEHVRKISPRC